MCQLLKPELTDLGSQIQLCASYHRQQTQNECHLSPKDRSIKSSFKERSELFIYRHTAQFLLRPAGILSRPPIQTHLKAQGNLRLVTTNVRLNSSSYYLRGESETVRPKTIQKRTTHQVKTRTQTHIKKKEREQADFNHLHMILHFILEIIYALLR